MKPEFLDDLTGGGKYNPAIRQLVGLYDFDQEQAGQLLSSIRETVLGKQEMLDLSTLAFIKVINCNLILRRRAEDTGLVIDDERTLYFDLTVEGFTNMAQITEGFCKEDRSGYHWLYDTWENPDLSEIGFLISPGGTW